MSDPLAQFRKTPPVPRKTDETQADGYVAFGAKDHVQRLQIRRTNDHMRAPGYAHLWDITSDAQFGTNFVLIYTFMFVLVRGKNLQAVVTALQLGTADFIQEFDAERWAMPSDANAPVIERIEVTMAGSTTTLAEVEQQFLAEPKGKPH